MKSALLLVVVGLSVITMAHGHGKHVRNREATELLPEQSDYTIQGQQVNQLARCSTKEITDEIREGGMFAVNLYKFKMARAGMDGQQYAAVSPRTIAVCFHVVGSRITREQLSRDLNALNKAYSGTSCCNPSQNWCVAGTCSPNTNIRFVMARAMFKRVIGTTLNPTDWGACVKRYPIDIDMENEEAAKVLTMKNWMRVGDARVLNVYIGKLSASLGYATFPNEYKKYPKRDGVVVGRDYIVGGLNPDYNEGDTLAHEVGHWLGVYHTFQDGCSPGDRVDDTPAEAEKNSGCDPSKNRDTCPTDTGLDPIHNFMDYSHDVCLFTWTQGQIDVMHANIEFYRSRKTPDLRPEQLYDGYYSEKYTMAPGFTRNFYIHVPTKSNVTCSTRAVGGDVNLYMNWGGSVTVFDCSSEGDDSTESCEIGPSTGAANAWVYSQETTVDFDIKCDLESV